MSVTGSAQQRTLNDAEVTFLEAHAAVDQAKGTIERLNETHLIPEDLFWEALVLIDAMGDLLDDLIRAVST